MLIFLFRNKENNEDFHPLTLKYNTQSTYCSTHKPKNNIFCFKLFSKKNTANIAKGFSIKTKKRLIQNEKCGIGTINDDMIDNLNSTCIKCMSADPNFSKFAETIEHQFNQQPSPMFKYHLLMCSFLFVSIVVVLFISDLKK